MAHFTEVADSAVPNIPNMRRRTVISLTLLIAIAIGIYWLGSELDPDTDTDTSVSIAFKRREEGPPFGAPGLDLTNSGSKSILLTRVWVQKWENGSWNNSSLVKFSTVLPFGQTNIDAFNPIFEPGECRRVVAEWPNNEPWRVKIQYAVEMSPISKGVIAFKTRDRSHLTNRTWNGTHYVSSRVIPK